MLQEAQPGVGPSAGGPPEGPCGLSVQTSTSRDGSGHPESAPGSLRATPTVTPCSQGLSYREAGEQLPGGALLTPDPARGKCGSGGGREDTWDRVMGTLDFQTWSWPPAGAAGAGWHVRPVSRGRARCVSGRQVCTAQGRAWEGPAQAGVAGEQGPRGLKCGWGLRACGTAVSGPKHTSLSDRPWEPGRGPGSERKISRGSQCSVGAAVRLRWAPARPQRGQCGLRGRSQPPWATGAASRLGATLRGRSDQRPFPSRHCHSGGQAHARAGGQATAPRPLQV